MWIDSMAPRMIRQAARDAPPSLSERLEEEWLADLSGLPGPMSRLSFAVGLLPGRNGRQPRSRHSERCGDQFTDTGTNMGTNM